MEEQGDRSLIEVSTATRDKIKVAAVLRGVTMRKLLEAFADRVDEFLPIEKPKK